VAGAGAVHAPPAQLSALVRTVPAHVAGWQTVPAGHVVQAPDPLQVPPSSPQVEAACDLQMP
jgi:hypothetical protein